MRAVVQPPLERPRVDRGRADRMARRGPLAAHYTTGRRATKGALITESPAARVVAGLWLARTIAAVALHRFTPARDIVWYSAGQKVVPFDGATRDRSRV